MIKLNIDLILDKIYEKVISHSLGDGMYCRYTAAGKNAPNPYGCADALNILYTLDRFFEVGEEREAHIRSLRSFQSREDGLFHEGSHHVFHTTAHCIAALELLDARPDRPLYALERFLNVGEVFSMLDEIDWLHCGRGAHAGAGIYAALVITESVGADWRRGYIEGFDRACNPKTGLWACEPVKDFPVKFQIGDAFHYYFNYSHAKAAMPYPEALIDSCLKAYNNGEMGENFGRQLHYIEMDWIYCLNRASWQTAHRFDEIKATLRSFAEGYISYLNALDWKNDVWADDLHLLFGVVCAIAELQRALPGVIESKKPLRLVLDRRPFI